MAHCCVERFKYTKFAFNRISEQCARYDLKMLIITTYADQ